MVGVGYCGVCFGFGDCQWCVVLVCFGEDSVCFGLGCVYCDVWLFFQCVGVGVVLLDVLVFDF